MEHLKRLRVKHLVTLWLSYEDQYNYLMHKYRSSEDPKDKCSYWNTACRFNTVILKPLEGRLSAEGIVDIELYEDKVVVGISNSYYATFHRADADYDIIFSIDEIELS